MNLSKWSEYSDGQRRGFMLAIQAATQARLMPPPKYVWIHGNAKLSDAELKVLQEWALEYTRVSPQNPGVSRAEAAAVGVRMMSAHTSPVLSAAAHLNPSLKRRNQ